MDKKAAARSTDVKERNRIVEQHQNIVWWAINKNRRLIAALRLEDQDVYQDLMIALMEAVDKYNPERGNLKSYIFMKLQYAILDLKRRHKPYGMKTLPGARPEVQSLDYMPEDGLPLEIPCECNYTTIELFDATNREEKKMKNTLADLNNYLFEQIERLQNDELDESGLEREIKRSEAVQKVAKTIIDNGSLALQAKKHLDEYGQGENVELPMLGVGAKAAQKS